MPQEHRTACAYRILRYTPNLIRDEWLNIGVVLLDPPRRHARARLIEEPGEFARVRRLHPNMDEEVLRALQADFERQFAAHAEDPQALLDRLDETLSNVLQLSPQKAVLAEDFDAEMDRLYRDHVEPPRFHARGAEVNSRIGLRIRVNEVFRRAGIWERTERGVPVAEFTYQGDPMKIDFAYRRNGTRGFVHALPLSRDPGQAKVLAFTAERVRARMAQCEFTAITEVEPRPENERHQFVAGLLTEQQVQLISLARLADFANRLRPELH